MIKVAVVLTASTLTSLLSLAREEEGAERQARVGCHSERSRGICYYFGGCTDYDFSAS